MRPETLPSLCFVLFFSFPPISPGQWGVGGHGMWGLLVPGLKGNAEPAEVAHWEFLLTVEGWVAPPAYRHKGSSVLWAQGSIPAPVAGREQHFLIRPQPPCQGWKAPTDCSFPFSSPGSSAGLECSPCCQAPPLLHSPHPTHFHSLPEPVPLEQNKQPRSLSHAGLAAA
jgi:hypothetical protein